MPPNRQRLLASVMWLTSHWRPVVSVLSIVVTGVLSAWIWDRFDRPHLRVATAVLHREVAARDSADARVVYGVVRDLETNCRVVGWEVPSHVADGIRPPRTEVEVYYKFLVSNTGRAAATRVTMGVALSPNPGAGQLVASPGANVSQSFSMGSDGSAFSRTFLLDALPAGATSLITLRVIADSALHEAARAREVIARVLFLASEQTEMQRNPAVPVDGATIAWQESMLYVGDEFLLQNWSIIKDTTSAHVPYKSELPWFQPLPPALDCPDQS